MIYCSIDIETTGLDIKKCDIVQFAAVLDDLNNQLPLEKLPTFNAYFSLKSFKGEPYALSMHPDIFRRIADARKNKMWGAQDDGNHYLTYDSFGYEFRNFLTRNNAPENPKTGAISLNIAGKNAAMFDLPFLKKKIKNWENVYFKHRVLDPAILFYQKGDEQLPDSKKCMERAGIPGEVAHTALEDALSVVQMLRKKLS
jgi:hypothetical protein